MAQPGYTPVSLYYSSVTSNAPTAGNLANGELAINIADGKLFYKDSAGFVQIIATKAGASGDVVGPASSTDNAVARFDGTTGKLIQNSVVTIADTTGDITGGAYNKVTITAPATGATLTIADGKSAIFNNSITFSGTDLTTMTFPASNQSIAGLGVAQTWSAAQTFRAANAVRSEAAATQDAVVLAGRAGGTSSYAAIITPDTLSASRTITLPDVDGTVLTTGAAVTVPQGGTGLTSTTAYAILAGGTTSTGNLQQVSGLGSSGQVLTSSGPGALPTWQNTASTMVYPGAGIAVSTGSAWTTSLTAPTGAVVGTTDTQTLTNKRINPRAVVAGATSGNLTINGDTTDVYEAEGLTGAITFLTPSGTPVDGQKLLIRIEDNGAGARGITWTTSSGAFRAVGITLPTTTVQGKVTYVGCFYNGSDLFWDAVATVTQA